MEYLSPHLRVKLIPVLQEIRDKCLRRGYRGLVDLRRVLGTRHSTTSTDVCAGHERHEGGHVSFQIDTTNNSTNLYRGQHADAAVNGGNATGSDRGSASYDNIYPHMEAEQLRNLLLHELGVEISNYSLKLICVGFQGDSGYIDLSALCAWVCGFSLPPYAEVGELRCQAVIELFKRLDPEGRGVINATTLATAVDPTNADYYYPSTRSAIAAEGTPFATQLSQSQLLSEVLLPPPHPVDETAALSFHSRYYSDVITQSEFVSYYAAVSDSCGLDTESFLACLHSGWVIPQIYEGSRDEIEAQARGGANARDLASFVAATQPESLRLRSLSRNGNGRHSVATVGWGASPIRLDAQGHKSVEKVAGYCGHIPMAQERFGETFQLVLDRVPHLGHQNLYQQRLRASLGRATSYRPDPIVKTMSTANIHSFKLA